MGGVVGLFAAREGGSLAASVALVFVPTAVVTVGEVGGLGTGTDAVEVATVLYVAGSLAVPVGRVVCGVGVLWRTGPWEPTLRDHLADGAELACVCLPWLIVAGLVVVASQTTRGLVNLGVVQTLLLGGGVLVATWIGLRRRGVETAVTVGVVPAALVVLAWPPGTVPGGAGDWSSVVVTGTGGGVVLDVPMGLGGYFAGRALRADATAPGGLPGDRR